MNPMTDKEEIKDGLVEEFYDNGQLKYRGNFNNGKPDGLYEEFYNRKHGQLSSRGNFKDGKREGLSEWFDIFGNLYRTETWKDGERVK